MKILKSDEIRRIELAAEESGLSMKYLMRAAGLSVAQQIEDMTSPPSAIAVLCGRGNNAGDGFVCALKLWEDGYDVIAILADGEPKTDLARHEYRRLLGKVRVVNYPEKPTAAETVIDQADIIIDALFGFGFSGTLSGSPLKLVELANQAKAKRLAIDLPTGVDCDSARVSEHAFKADYTVTFTALKPALVSYPAKGYCGEVFLRQVGVPDEFISEARSNIVCPELEDISALLPKLDPNSNKGSHGTLAIVCGSHGMTGACVMAARAALRSGVGLVNIVTEASTYPIIAAQVPEAVYTIVDYSVPHDIEKLKLTLEKADACLVGCGMGKALSEKICDIVFASCKAPIVIDADALNFLSRHKEKLHSLNANTVFTPHPGEISRLTGRAVDDIQSDRMGAAQSFARENGGILLLKGAASIIANGSQLVVNPTGNAGMAKGGNGDVLSGIIASLLAQGISPFEATIAGTYIHGMAGDICASQLSQRATLPTDIIDSLAEVFTRIEKL